ncbi:MAG: sulfite exporter TauE/SafE family protein [Desulfomicrobium sp.]|nr:sulfite exporter TauE/SafE family protein [Pseudomonadota bacterium]MBV1713788.1 sulfite exporter TauE/SafE family protein [Desulfomicrobium sp.]MBU4572323.1 sulfite exporter TauE/SafE family protein [Pseudomonadota bacterium]MBU4594301.1 sulfite exporter TauE/SafE family protein [Pseudomonadota bacterium]MBV1719470.1 sulfite exporter TauE/SafE family protein [Desulfomicrobium sp.]
MDQFLILIHQWMGSGLALAALGCFLWGMVSVLFSPCHLASIPLIVGYVAGQDKLVEGRQAALYAGLFTFGLFLTIAAIGVICALLGRMLGDVGPYWTIVVGLILLWVAMDMLGVSKCSMGGNLMGRFKLRGMSGAFLLGLAYGILSGSCTFGFIAPILAIITVQEKIMTGIMLIVLFGLGHCIPIVIAGSSTALVRRLMANASWQRGGTAFRRIAGILIGLMGVYFIARPFLPV